jgi:hypothetical protein
MTGRRMTMWMSSGALAVLAVAAFGVLQAVPSLAENLGKRMHVRMGQNNFAFPESIGKIGTSDPSQAAGYAVFSFFYSLAKFEAGRPVAESTNVGIEDDLFHGSISYRPKVTLRTPRQKLLFSLEKNKMKSDDSKTLANGFLVYTPANKWNDEFYFQSRDGRDFYFECGQPGIAMRTHLSCHVMEQWENSIIADYYFPEHRKADALKIDGELKTFINSYKVAP